MPSHLHAALKRRGLAVFIDVRLLAKGLKQRLPVAVARRRAEYVLIDHHRVPLGDSEDDFIRVHLARIDHARDGLGYTKWSEIPRIPPSAKDDAEEPSPLLPPPGPPGAVRSVSLFGPAVARMASRPGRA